MRTWSPTPDGTDGALQASHPFGANDDRTLPHLSAAARSMSERFDGVVRVETEDGDCAWGRFGVAKVESDPGQPLKRIWIVCSPEVESAVLTWMGADAHVDLAHRLVLAARPMPRLGDELLAMLLGGALKNFTAEGQLHPFILSIHGRDVTTQPLLGVPPEQFPEIVQSVRAKVALTKPDAVGVVGESGMVSGGTQHDVLAVYVETPVLRRRFILPVTGRRTAGWKLWQTNTVGDPFEIEAGATSSQLVGFFG